MSGRPIATTRSAAGMPTGLLAVWWVIVSEIVIFGGLLAAYIMYRLAHDQWSSEAAATNVYIGTFNTFVLLTSSLFAVLAHQAAEAGNTFLTRLLSWQNYPGVGYAGGALHFTFGLET